MVNLKAEDKDRDDLEKLLRAAHRYADGCKAGLSKDQLDALRWELARALEMMDDDSRFLRPSEIQRQEGQKQVSQLKSIALTVLLLGALISFAKDRKWQEAKFIESGSSESGTVVVPLPSTTTGTVTSSGTSAYGTATTTGGMTFAVPAQNTYYVFRGESAIYVAYFNPLLHWKRPNLTLGSMVKIAPEGNKLYFINDDGKQAHLPLAEQRLIEK